jgi:Transposase DDE domain
VSQQNAVNKLFRELGCLEELPTGSAYCQARQKLKPELFVHLNNVTLEEFTEISRAEGSLRTWHGHRLLGADGTKLNLPDTAPLREKFTVVGNQHGKAGECVQGLGMVLYDLLHDLGVAAHLGPLTGEADLLMEKLWERTRPADVLVLDRGFADYSLIAWAAGSGRHLIIRCPRQSFGVVNQFWASEEQERLVTLRCSTRRSTRAYVRKHSLADEVEVRLLKFELPGGEQEVLLTTLCDRQKYAREDFYKVYGWRWRQETYYDRIKNTFEIERFSGLSLWSIEQDFYGVLFLATLESTLVESAQSEMEARTEERGLSNRPKVNRAVSYVALLDHTVSLLIDPTVPLESVLSQLHQLLKTNPKRHRSGRKFDRPPRSLARSLRHQKYRKRITA